jgi:acyl-CoA synthetase (AMP-forming)/AMP-acid ligase II
VATSARTVISPRSPIDRSKDVVKSGGEWISSVELENTIMGHPQVVEAAVIAIPTIDGRRPP